MNGITFPTSDIILVTIIILVVLVNVVLNLVTLAKAIGNRKVNERTYVLVQKFLGSHLLITAMALRRVAQMSGDAHDADLASKAEQAYRDHAGC